MTDTAIAAAGEVSVSWSRQPGALPGSRWHLRYKAGKVGGRQRGLEAERRGQVVPREGAVLPKGQPDASRRSTPHDKASRSARSDAFISFVGDLILHAQHHVAAAQVVGAHWDRSRIPEIATGTHGNARLNRDKGRTFLKFPKSLGRSPALRKIQTRRRDH